MFLISNRHVCLEAAVLLHKRRSQQAPPLATTQACQELRREIGRLWKLKVVVSVVIGALGGVTKDFERWIKTLGLSYNIGVMQLLPCWVLQEYCGKC